MGLDFLRHIERTRVLVHLLDGARPDPLSDMDALNSELKEYGDSLAARPQEIVVNKVDLPEVSERMSELQERFDTRGMTPQFISAAGGEGTDELVQRLAQMLAVGREGEPMEDDEPIRPQPLRRRFEVTPEDGGFRVEGERVVTFAEMMPVEMEEGRQELWRRLGRWGVIGALRRAGAQPGDRVRLGSVELEWPG